MNKSILWFLVYYVCCSSLNIILSGTQSTGCYKVGHPSDYWTGSLLFNFRNKFRRHPGWLLLFTKLSLVQG